MPEIVQSNRTKFDCCVTLCAALGGVAGFLLSLLYRRNISMEQQLRRAIRRDKLKIDYQPILNLATRRIVGAEALVHWTDEEGNAAPPDIFARFAQRQGFVSEITRLVLRHVLTEFGSLLRNRPDFRVSINITSDDLADPMFLDWLEVSPAGSGLTPKSLTIEITEGSTVRYDLAMKAIYCLHERGHNVHIDDFGTGHSSLSYLQDLSVDAIKIDRSFTQSIGTGSVTMAILPQILAMAEALDLGVIVERVETEEQAEYFASARHPVMAQGWLFGRLVAAQEFCRGFAESERKEPVETVEEKQAMATIV